MWKFLSAWFEFLPPMWPPGGWSFPAAANGSATARNGSWHADASSADCLWSTLHRHGRAAEHAYSLWIGTNAISTWAAWPRCRPLQLQIISSFELLHQMIQEHGEKRRHRSRLQQAYSRSK
mmetsp:Transcript_17314/g.38354  ORF Transcript_17314/g.38354 Transcript_17314/m.38354 type:complete len:121 (+) Transcript_17314:2397-2759(+)